MTDLCTYEYNVSIGVPPPTLWNYITHYHISQTLGEFNIKLKFLLGDILSTWVNTYNGCIVRFSKTTDNWNTILWKIIINWQIENVEKVNNILISMFPIKENCISKKKSWESTKNIPIIIDDWLWNSGWNISTKA